MKKICILTDIEGVAGVVSHTEHSYATGPFYEHSKRLLTQEVNAGVEGLRSVGVEEVLVIDAHGPGGIVFEELHPEARLLHGRPITRQQLYGPIHDCDALTIIGQHAMAGTRHGNQNHTLSSLEIDSMHLNNQPIGEIALLALWAGAKEVPLIFVSGDEAACAEAEALIPGVVTAAVKKGISSNVEITLSATAARCKIREQIAKAVETHRKMPLPPHKRPGPYHFDIRWKNTQLADLSEHRQGCARVDSQTVRFSSPDLLDVLCERHRCST